jgi:hypothetical protein
LPTSEREKGVPYMLAHADVLERLLDQHAPDAPVVALPLSQDLFLRAFTWVRLELGIPLPPAAG